MGRIVSNKKKYSLLKEGMFWFIASLFVLAFYIFALFATNHYAVTGLHSNDGYNTYNLFFYINSTTLLDVFLQAILPLMLILWFVWYIFKEIYTMGKTFLIAIFETIDLKRKALWKAYYDNKTTLKDLPKEYQQAFNLRERAINGESMLILFGMDLLVIIGFAFYLLTTLATNSFGMLGIFLLILIAVLSYIIYDLYKRDKPLTTFEKQYITRDTKRYERLFPSEEKDEQPSESLPQAQD